MKFQVHGELDIPKEVTELLTGMTYSGHALPFQDIEMKLSQTALDRLSVILHLVYATQSLEEVKAYVDDICSKKQEPVVQPPQPVYQYAPPFSPMPVTYNTPSTNPSVTIPIQKSEHAVSAQATKALQPSEYTIPDAKVSEGTAKQNISTIANRMRSRVG